jgi:hypothetical protein
MRWTVLAIGLFALTLSGCDDKSQPQSGGATGQVAKAVDGVLAASGSLLTGQSGTADLPPEIIAATAYPKNIVWLDFPFNSHSCNSNPNTFYEGIYLKPDNQDWPAELDNDGYLQDEHPSFARFDNSQGLGLVNQFVRDLLAKGFVQQVAHTYSPVQTLYCLILAEGRIGASYHSYKTAAGVEMRGLVDVATFVIARTEMVSEFDKARVQGYVTKHRKYHLFATLAENPAFGSTTYQFERDMVIYFDPEDRVWREDASDETTWLLKT